MCVHVFSVFLIRLHVFGEICSDVFTHELNDQKSLKTTHQAKELEKKFKELTNTQNAEEKSEAAEKKVQVARSFIQKLFLFIHSHNERTSKALPGPPTRKHG